MNRCWVWQQIKAASYSASDRHRMEYETIQACAREADGVEVKANVQKRRQDRIRELQTRKRVISADGLNTPDVGQSGPHSVYGLPGGVAPPQHSVDDVIDPKLGPDEQPLWIRGSIDPDFGGDPEAAWKHREKELLRWYSDSDNGNIYGRIPDQPRRNLGSRPGGGGPVRRLLIGKTIVAILLFAVAGVVFQLDTPWSQEGKQYIRSALSEDMDFERIAAWYHDTFSGTPSFLPAFGNKQNATKVQAHVTTSKFVQPVKGKTKVDFASTKQGIWLETKKDAHVAAMDDGRIEFTGEVEDTGHTLVIQHADGYRMTYGGLQPTKWEAGDWVKAGDLIGTAREDGGKGTVFLAVMKDQRYVNPLDVVAFD